MRQRSGVETRRVFWRQQLRPCVLGMLEGIVGKRIERFKLRPRLLPETHGRDVPALPVCDEDGGLCAARQEKGEHEAERMRALFEDEQTVIEAPEGRACRRRPLHEALQRDEFW